MLNESSILKLNPNILKRFEHNVEDGVLFLYNVKTKLLWKGNESSNYMIKLIDGNRSLKEIYKELQNIFDGYSYEELKNSLDSLIENLITLDIIELAG